MSENHRPALMPADTPDYMAPAWIGCVSWAASDPDMLAAFRHDTGNNWLPSRDGFGAMIDKATGADVAFFEAFVAWVNENVWGSIDGDEGDE